MRPDSIRTFVAMDLPAGVLDQIGHLQDELRSFGWKIKWVRSGNMHLTLKFLGDVPEADLAGIQNAIASVVSRQPPLCLTVKGIGVFPNLRRPRILWAGFGGDIERLRELQASIDTALFPVGFAKDTRRFKPHLTIGRFKGPAGSRSLAEAVVRFSVLTLDAFTLDRLFLYRSDLEPAGAVYTKLGTFEMNNKET